MKKKLPVKSAPKGSGAPVRRAPAPPARRPASGLGPVAMGFLLLAAVAVGLLLPGLSAGIQEQRTDRLEQTVDLGQNGLSLTSDAAKLEKLRILGNLLGGSGNLIDLDTEGRFMTAAGASAMFDKAADLVKGTGLNVGGLTRSDVTESSPKLLVSASGSATSMVWEVSAFKDSDTGWHSFDFLVDDATGLILAAQYTGVDDTLEEEEYEQPDWSGAAEGIVENLARSYAFSNTQLRLSGGLAINRDSTQFNINYLPGEISGDTFTLALPLVIGRYGWSVNNYE